MCSNSIPRPVTVEPPIFCVVAIFKVESKDLELELVIHILAAAKIGDSPINSDMILGQQMHLGAESQSERTIELVPKSWKLAIIIPRHRGGT